MRKVVVELEWILEIPEDAPDFMEAVGAAMDSYAHKPFKDVICEMRYVGEHEVNPWESQNWKQP